MDTATATDDCSGWARPSRLTAYDLQPILDQVASNCECGAAKGDFVPLQPQGFKGSSAPFVCEWDRPRRLTTLELDEALYEVYMDLYGEPI